MTYRYHHHHRRSPAVSTVSCHHVVVPTKTKAAAVDVVVNTFVVVVVVIGISLFGIPEVGAVAAFHHHHHHHHHHHAGSQQRSSVHHRRRYYLNHRWPDGWTHKRINRVPPFKLYANDDTDENNAEEEEECANEVSADDEMSNLLRNFQDRQAQLQKQSQIQRNKLRQAQCQSGVSLTLPDWVRRLDVQYPLIACGSASGTVYIAHLETGQLLGSTSTTTMTSSTTTTSTIVTEARIDHVVNQLYGRFDGGGTIAVAMYKNVLVESRRTGGVHIWRIHSTTGSTSDNKNSDTTTASSSNKVELLSQGSIPSLQNCIVTTLRIEDEYLWVGTDVGTVEAYALNDEDDSSNSRLPLSLRTQPDIMWNVGGTSSTSSSLFGWTPPSSNNNRGSGTVVMSLDVCPQLLCVVAATDSGTIQLLSYDDDEEDEHEDTKQQQQQQTTPQQQQQQHRVPIGSFTPPFDSTERRSFNVYPTCVAFVATGDTSTTATTTDKDNSGNLYKDYMDRLSAVTTTSMMSQSEQQQSPPSYSIACGANDGTLFLQPLSFDTYGDLDYQQPIGLRPRQLMPQHLASVQCMRSPSPGLLLTGGLDGTIRLWDTDTKKFLYQFVGYKVWLGSIWTDGERIVTDGADNTIIVHDYSKDNIMDPKPRKKTDENDNDNRRQSPDSNNTK